MRTKNEKSSVVNLDNGESRETFHVLSVIRGLINHRLLGIRGGFGDPGVYITISLSLKIGINIATTIPPTVTPRKLISKGSIREVSPSTVASTSCL